MELILTSRNGKVSDRQRDHIEQKLRKLTRYTDQITSMKVEVSSEQRQDKGEVHRMQATLMGEHGIILRADQTAADLYSVTDQVQDVLQRQIKRHKEKHWRRGKLRRKSGEFVAVEDWQPPVSLAEVEEEKDDDEERQILRVKEFTLKPMYSDEAIEQMELLEHSFFVFRDADTSRVNIVYRRNDGNYGLLIPQDT